MPVRRLTTRAALLSLALVIFSSGALTRQTNTEASDSAAPLRFGQSIAVSDFDCDGLVDEARLEGSSFRKSVSILLTGTRKRSFLHLNGSRANHGSLFARDVDEDGAIDLIWTDTFRANELVVWLGDGSGNFVEVDSSAYSGFAYGGTDIGEPDESNQETAINFENNRPLDQTPSPKRLDQSAGELPNDYPDRRDSSSPALGQPVGRAPPFLFS